MSNESFFNLTEKDGDDVSNVSGSSTGPIDKNFIWSAFYAPQPVLISLYCIIILLSLSSNILVITIVIKFHYMRNVTNIFLVNLAVADLLVTLISMPVALFKAFTLLWLFGEDLCKITYYAQCVAVAASVFTITTMSVDRFIAIAQPARLVRYRIRKRKWAAVVIAILWIKALLIFTPYLWAIKLEVTDIDEITFCSEDWSSSGLQQTIFGPFSYSLVFAIPGKGSIIIACYSLMGRRLCAVKPPFDTDEGGTGAAQGIRLLRERRRIALVLLMLAALFAICWLPYNTITLLLDLEQISQNFIDTILPYMLLLGHANSAMNPLLYCLLAKNFRKSIKKLLWRENPEAHPRCRIRFLHPSSSNSQNNQVPLMYCRHDQNRMTQSSNLSSSSLLKRHRFNFQRKQNGQQTFL